MATYDLVIVGAGVHGLCMAKTYCEIHPDAKLLIIDSAGSIGGVWAKERLYPGLRTNNMVGHYEFSDFPMVPEEWGLKENSFIPGQVVHDYLTAAAKKFGFFNKCQFETKVMSAELKDDIWTLELSARGKAETIRSTKLVLATGLTSDPKLPKIEGMSTFKGSLFHARELANRVDQLKKASDIVIIGGSKSAYDTVNLCCTQTDARVHWLIRESGHGTNWISPAFVTPLKKALETLVVVRFLTWFSPCVWSWAGDYQGPIWFLQQTWFGRLLCQTLFAIITSDVVGLTGYDRHPETKKLKPRNSVYWTAGAVSILNYDADVFEFVRSGRVNVSISDITRIEPDGVLLANNNKIPANAIICCTGWDHTQTLTFNPPIAATSIHSSSNNNNNISEAEILQEEQRIYTLLPLLKTRPTHPQSLQPNPPSNSLHLYMFMLPPTSPFLQSRNLAFIGHHLTVSTFMMAQVQSLWLTAYFDGDIERMNSANKDEIREATKQTVAYERLRHPPEAGGYGDKFGDLAFESLYYIDFLLRDLGVRWKRKEGWLKDVFEPYGPQDYVGLVQEWLALKTGGGGDGEGKKRR